MSRAMCRTSGAAFCLAKGTFPVQGFSFPQPPDDTKRPLRRRKRGMLKEATILDKIDGKFIPHLSSKMVRFSFRVVCYTAVFSVVTQRSSPSVTTLKTAVWQTSFRAASSFNFFWGGGEGGRFAIPVSSFCCPRLDVSRGGTRETSPAAKSEEKRMFPQARGQSVLRPLEHGFSQTGGLIWTQYTQ